MGQDRAEPDKKGRKRLAEEECEVLVEVPERTLVREIVARSVGSGIVFVRMRERNVSGPRRLHVSSKHSGPRTARTSCRTVHLPQTINKQLADSPAFERDQDRRTPPKPKDGTGPGTPVESP